MCVRSPLLLLLPRSCVCGAGVRMPVHVCVCTCVRTEAPKKPRVRVRVYLFVRNDSIVFSWYVRTVASFDVWAFRVV